MFTADVVGKINLCLACLDFFPFPTLSSSDDPVFLHGALMSCFYVGACSSHLRISAFYRTLLCVVTTLVSIATRYSISYRSSNEI